MSETKFTKGEWTVEAGYFSGDLLVADSSGNITQVIFRGEEETKANAHLIAAAPDLYLVVARLAELLETGNPIGQATLGMAQRALAKARGETQ